MITTLFFHLGKRDDLMLLPPFVDALLTVEPELRPVFITTPENQSFLQAPPPLSELRVYEPSWTWAKKRSFIQSLRKLNPIYSFSLSPDLTSHLFCYLTGAGVRGAIVKKGSVWVQFLVAYLSHHRVLMENPPILSQKSPLEDLSRKMGFLL